MLEPTRGENVLDIVLSSQKELVDNVKILEPLGNFHKGNSKDMRKYLAKLDWNNMLMNKAAIESWNILKYEIECIINKFVPFQKQRKLERNTCQEAIRKIVLKQTMWKVYRRTRKEEDCKLQRGT